MRRTVSQIQLLRQERRRALVESRFVVNNGISGICRHLAHHNQAHRIKPSKRFGKMLEDIVKAPRMKESSHLGFVHRFEPATHPGLPALLLLHGSGGDESSLLALGRAVAPGAALLSVKGQVVDHGLARFFGRPGNPSAFDPEIQLRTAELADFSKAAARHYKLLQRFILLGFSNGANIGVHLLLHGKTNWAGAILMRGMAADDLSPHNDLHATPVLILSGINDPIVQSDQAEDLAVQLRNAGAEVTLNWEESGHNISQGDILMAFDWMRRFYEVARPMPGSQ